MTARTVICLALLALAGCAAPGSREQAFPAAAVPAIAADPAPAAAALPPTPTSGASALDPTLFCYYEGQAYSPGATREGMVCGAAEDLSVYSATRQVKPLQWLPVQP